MMEPSDVVAKAREDRLLVESVGSERVVYDVDSDRAHLLDELTVAIWDRCDGLRTLGQLSVEASAATGTIVTPLAVEHGLDQLAAAGLLEDEPGSRLNGLSRRELLKRAGVAAISLPVITSILAPTPAAALSSGPAQGSICDAGSGALNSTVTVAQGVCASRCCRKEVNNNSATNGRCRPCSNCSGSPCGAGGTCGGSTTTACCNTTSGNCN